MGVLQLTFCSCSMVNGNDASTPLNMSRNSVSLWAPCNSKAALCFQLQKLLLVVLYKLAAQQFPNPGVVTDGLNASRAWRAHPAASQLWGSLGQASISLGSKAVCFREAA